MDLVIAEESPRTPDVVSLPETHLAFAAVQSPAEHVHALDPLHAQAGDRRR